MISINPQVLKDIARIKLKLENTAKEIKSDTQNVVIEVGQLGFNYAFNLAPELTGALKRAMRLEFPNNQEAIIISSQPMGDAIPIHILFDTGLYPNPRRESSLGFMWQTAKLLETEFSKRIKLAVSQSINKFGFKI